MMYFATSTLTIMLTIVALTVCRYTLPASAFAVLVPSTTAGGSNLGIISSPFCNSRSYSMYPRRNMAGEVCCSVMRRFTARSSHNGVVDDDIDLDTAMSNARANLAEGRSPGAGLKSAYDQADAAFADLIVTSVDDQGVSLEENDVEELAKGGKMDKKDTAKKSKGLFGDIADVFGALKGGAHIVKREDGTL